MGELTTEAEVTSLSDEPALVQCLARHYEDGTLSDISVRVGSRTFAAHRFVLACMSDVFRSMLYGGGWAESRAGTTRDVLDLHESTDCEQAFEPFLRFLYTASVKLAPENVVGILCLADKYNVEHLRKLCLHFMLDHCKPQLQENVRHAVNWYALSIALNLKDIANVSRATIAWNAVGIMTSPEWPNLEQDFLCDMLSSSDLVVPNELTVFDSVQRWLLDEDHGDRREDSHAIHSVLSLVRFSQMTVTELRSCEDSDLATKSGGVCSAAVGQLLGKAYRFHALCSAGISSVRAACKASETAFYTPRDYLDNTVDSVRVQNAVRFGMVVEVKTRSSPAPDDRRDADWRLSYRRSDRVWTLLTQCLDSRLTTPPTADDSQCCMYRATALIFDDAERIVQVAKTGALPCRRGTPCALEIALDEPISCRQMVVLLKPCIY